MNKNDIIRMAQEAGFCHDTNSGIYLCAPMHIECFAYIVRKATLEEAAGVCEGRVCEITLPQHYTKQMIPAKDEALLLAACADCAVAIRMRGRK